MSDAYDWADDASRCYGLAIKTLRDRYLKERLPGETARTLTRGGSGAVAGGYPNWALT